MVSKFQSRGKAAKRNKKGNNDGAVIVGGREEIETEYPIAAASKKSTPPKKKVAKKIPVLRASSEGGKYYETKKQEKKKQRQKKEGEQDNNNHNHAADVDGTTKQRNSRRRRRSKSVSSKRRQQSKGKSSRRETLLPQTQEQKQKQKQKLSINQQNRPRSTGSAISLSKQRSVGASTKKSSRSSPSVAGASRRSIRSGTAASSASAPVGVGAGAEILNSPSHIVAVGAVLDHISKKGFFGSTGVFAKQVETRNQYMIDPVKANYTKQDMPNSKLAKTAIKSSRKKADKSCSVVKASADDAFESASDHSTLDTYDHDTRTYDSRFHEATSWGNTVEDRTDDDNDDNDDGRTFEDHTDEDHTDDDADYDSRDDVEDNVNIRDFDIDDTSYDPSGTDDDAGVSTDDNNTFSRSFDGGISHTSFTDGETHYTDESGTLDDNDTYYQTTTTDGTFDSGTSHSESSSDDSDHSSSCSDESDSHDESTSSHSNTRSSSSSTYKGRSWRKQRRSLGRNLLKRKKKQKRPPLSITTTGESTDGPQQPNSPLTLQSLTYDSDIPTVTKWPAAVAATKKDSSNHSRNNNNGNYKKKKIFAASVENWKEDESKNMDPKNQTILLKGVGSSVCDEVYTILSTSATLTSMSPRNNRVDTIISTPAPVAEVVECDEEIVPQQPEVDTSKKEEYKYCDADAEDTTNFVSSTKITEQQEFRNNKKKKKLVVDTETTQGTITTIDLAYTDLTPAPEITEQQEFLKKKLVVDTETTQGTITTIDLAYTDFTPAPASVTGTLDTQNSGSAVGDDCDTNDEDSDVFSLFTALDRDGVVGTDRNNDNNDTNNVITAVGNMKILTSSTPTSLLLTTAWDTVKKATSESMRSTRSIFFQDDEDNHDDDGEHGDGDGDGDEHGDGDKHGDGDGDGDIGTDNDNNNVKTTTPTKTATSAPCPLSDEVVDTTARASSSTVTPKPTRSTLAAAELKKNRTGHRSPRSSAATVTTPTKVSSSSADTKDDTLEKEKTATTTTSSPKLSCSLPMTTYVPKDLLSPKKKKKSATTKTKKKLPPRHTTDTIVSPPPKNNSSKGGISIGKLMRFRKPKMAFLPGIGMIPNTKSIEEEYAERAAKAVVVGDDEVKVVGKESSSNSNDGDDNVSQDDNHTVERDEGTVSSSPLVCNNDSLISCHRGNSILPNSLASQDERNNMVKQKEFWEQVKISDTKSRDNNNSYESYLSLSDLLLPQCCSSPTGILNNIYDNKDDDATNSKQQQSQPVEGGGVAEVVDKDNRDKDKSVSNEEEQQEGRDDISKKVIAVREECTIISNKMFTMIGTLFQSASSLVQKTSIKTSIDCVLATAKGGKPPQPATTNKRSDKKKDTSPSTRPYDVIKSPSHNKKPKQEEKKKCSTSQAPLLLPPTTCVVKSSFCKDEREEEDDDDNNNNNEKEDTQDDMKSLTTTVVKETIDATVSSQRSKSWKGGNRKYLWSRAKKNKDKRDVKKNSNSKNEDKNKKELFEL